MKETCWFSPEPEGGKSVDELSADFAKLDGGNFFGAR